MMETKILRRGTYFWTLFCVRTQDPRGKTCSAYDHAALCWMVLNNTLLSCFPLQNPWQVFFSTVNKYQLVVSNFVLIKITWFRNNNRENKKKKFSYAAKKAGFKFVIVLNQPSKCWEGLQALRNVFKFKRQLWWLALWMAFSCKSGFSNSLAKSKSQWFPNSASLKSYPYVCQ